VKAAYDYLEKNCKHLDTEWGVTIDCRIGQGSVDLRGVYETKRLLANDTSFGVGFAPFSETEMVTLETEKYINGKLCKSMPELGEDVKVMACRMEDEIDLTIAVAMVDCRLANKKEYKSSVAQLVERVEDFAQKFTERKLAVYVNTADDYKNNIFYLTVSGLSMENGDDGSVGRGNRANGLITPMRPMSMEASAGKNPVTHVGKLYNILANQVANDIVKAGRGDLVEVHTRILSQIGKPIDTPQAASAKMVYADNVNPKKYERDIAAIFDDRLSRITELTDKIVAGKISVF
jgi:S-adenosylmethionine synthetase